MKKTLLILTSAILASTVLTANASYMAIYGEKQINGDNIRFISKWLKSDPLLGDWLIVGSPTGCSAWTPDPSTKDIDVTFEQSATGCSQEQTRTVQEREKNNVTHEYRPVGSATNENRTLTNQTITRSAVGTKTKEECDIPNSTWVAGGPAYRLLNITSNGVLVYSGSDYDATEKVISPYKYTKGIITANYGSYTINKVCRSPL